MYITKLKVVLAAICLVFAVPAFSATITIEAYQLLEDTPNQPIKVYVSSDDPPEFIAGMDFYAQIADGGPDLPIPFIGIIDGPEFDPFIPPSSIPVDFVTGTIWGDSPFLVDSNVVDGGQVVISGVMVGVGEGAVVLADGLLGTIFVDTTDFFHGDSREPWDLSLIDTIAGSTELLDVDGNSIDSTIVLGEIMLVQNPSTIVMLLSGFATVLGILVYRYRVERRRM